MADLAQLRDRIRKRVKDYPGPGKYTDDYYDESIDRGLHRINSDLGTSFASIAAVPASREEYLLELRGTIEMCYVRATEESSGDSTVQGPVQATTVPGLTVNRSVKAPAGPAFWLDLAERLEREYNQVLDKLSESGETAEGSFQEAVMFRTGFRRMQRTPYKLDKAITAPALAASGSASGVSLSWSAIYDENFGKYVIWRSASSSMAGETKVKTLTDNHDEKYSDEPGSGTWYYQLEVEKDNGLKSRSAVASAVVP